MVLHIQNLEIKYSFDKSGRYIIEQFAKMNEDHMNKAKKGGIYEDFNEIFIILSTVLCVSGIALALNQTFDSQINPKEFQSWTVIEKHQTGPGQGTAVLENPDSNAKIKKEGDSRNIGERSFGLFIYY